MFYIYNIFLVSYTMDDLIFDWEEETPLVVDSHIELPQHNLIDAKLGECHEVYSSGKLDLKI